MAVEYAACFANAEGGAVVFGVADRTRGRAKAIHGASGYDLDTWRRGIFDSTRPNLAVEVEELRVPEGTGRLLVVRVPRGEHPPYGTAQGLFKQRVGKNCMPMDGQRFVKSRIATGAMDWSGERSRELTIADLDAVESRWLAGWPLPCWAARSKDGKCLFSCSLRGWSMINNA